MKKILTLTSVFALLAACEPRGSDINSDQFATATDLDTTIDATQPVEIIPGLQQADGSIAENPNSITLSDYSQEQQKIDRERYAAQIAAIAAGREEVTSVSVPTIGEVNPAKYARSTTNALGVSVYSRSGKRGNCNSYSTSYEAQRAFLEAGGPTTDSRGLDPDGDGFACQFNPTPYRSL